MELHKNHQLYARYIMTLQGRSVDSDVVVDSDVNVDSHVDVGSGSSSVGVFTVGGSGAKDGVQQE